VCNNVIGTVFGHNVTSTNLHLHEHYSLRTYTNTTDYELTRTLQLRICSFDEIYTYHSRFIPEGIAEASLLYSSETPTFYQNY
jgi:hypothetical protein